MAEIDVVKKGSRAWVWIVMIAVLALIVWFMMARGGPQTGSLMQEGGQPLYAAVLPLPVGLDR